MRASFCCSYTILFVSRSLSRHFFTRNIINTTIIQNIHPFHSIFLIHSSPLLSNSLLDLRNKFSVNIIHARLVKNGQNKNHILNLHVKSKHLGAAHKLFDEISDRDVQTWTIMISGFTRNGFPRMAVDLFLSMLEQGSVPNHFTLSSILKCCSSLKELPMGKAIHGWILRYVVVLDVVLANSVLDMYVKCGAFDYADGLFRLMHEKDTVSWNIMIGAHLLAGDMKESMNLFRLVPFKDVATWNSIIDGHTRNGFERIALNLLYQMAEIGPAFNKVTFSIALVLVSCLSLLELGKEIHGRVLRMGIHNDGFIGNSLIDLYCKCGQMEKASAVFENLMQNSNDFSDESRVGSVSWSSMITGYIQTGRLEDALKLFNSIIHGRIEVDLFTLTSIISASGNAGLLELGQQIHGRILKHGQTSDVFLASAMIDMYAKCGRLDDAWLSFRLTTNRNIVLWTSMISSCASHGQGRKAIELFELMLSEGIRPNDVTFIGVLAACSHRGLFAEGCKYFLLMKEVYGIKPSVEHFTCMVDLFGRAGRLDMIKDFIHDNGISHLSAVWKSFLSSCRVHKNIEMAKWVSEKLVKLEPFEAGPYILLSNTCANSCRWEEVAKLRALMKERDVRKSPGRSWIQL